MIGYYRELVYNNNKKKTDPSPPAVVSLLVHNGLQVWALMQRHSVIKVSTHFAWGGPNSHTHAHARAH